MGNPKHCCPPPKNMIGPRVNHLAKYLRKALNQAISEQGLFSGQQDILFNVLENEGITLGELADLLGVAVATASVSVKRMEKAGFIYKKADGSDARVIRLYPTDKARQAPENIRHKMDLIDDVLKSGMSESEIEAFSALLDRAIDNIKKEEGSL